VPPGGKVRLNVTGGLLGAEAVFESYAPMAAGDLLVLETACPHLDRQHSTRSAVLCVYCELCDLLYCPFGEVERHGEGGVLVVLGLSSRCRRQLGGGWRVRRGRSYTASLRLCRWGLNCRQRKSW
jgi:hypothetical protein